MIGAGLAPAGAFSSEAGPEQVALPTFDDASIMKARRALRGGAVESGHATFTSGADCEANGAISITTLADCSAAAAALGLSDTTAVDDGLGGFPNPPPGCYLRYGSLNFDSAGTNTGGCDGSDTCICWVNAPPLGAAAQSVEASAAGGLMGARRLSEAGVFGTRAALKTAVDDFPTSESTHGSISGWDVSRVDDLSGCCYEGSKGCGDSCPGFFPVGFNGDVSAWDSSRVTTMDGTFATMGRRRLDPFNQPLAWDTSQVTTNVRRHVRRHVLQRAGAWDTSRSASRHCLQPAARLGHEQGDDDVGTFYGRRRLQPALAGTRARFTPASSFNQPLDWDTSKVTTFWVFNQQLVWDTSKVTNMDSTFQR